MTHTDTTRYLGFIALATDHGIEDELHRYLPAKYRPITARTNLYAAESPDQSSIDIAVTARLLLPDSPLAGIGYGCTSGSLILGDPAVTDAITTGRPDVSCHTTLGSMIAALHAVGAHRIAVLSPYDPDLGATLDRELAHHFSVVGSAHHDIATDWDIASTPTTTIAEWALDLAASVQADAIAIACNALRAIGAITHIEEAAGIPVIAATQALIWSLLAADGTPTPASLGVLSYHQNVHEHT